MTLLEQAVPPTTICPQISAKSYYAFREAGPGFNLVKCEWLVAATPYNFLHCKVLKALTVIVSVRECDYSDFAHSDTPIIWVLKKLPLRLNFIEKSPGDRFSKN